MPPTGSEITDETGVRWEGTAGREGREGWDGKGCEMRDYEEGKGTREKKKRREMCEDEMER